jgi:hypothetical protein
MRLNACLPFSLFGCTPLVQTRDKKDKADRKVMPYGIGRPHTFLQHIIPFPIEQQKM